MDRFNWNYSTADYNNHEYYSQPYQEYGQHSSQPETGQTFGGVAASGPSWSYTTPGQPQSYPDSNFPQWIPPSPSLGSDLEYLLRTPQPTPLENILQNDASPEPPELPGPSKAQTGVKKRRRRDFAEIRELFLAGLDNYAQGRPLKHCSETLYFFQYVTDAGERKADGDSLYNRLEQKDKDRFDQAIADRKACKKGPDADKVRTSFMEALHAYANGASLTDCSANISFDVYVSSKGYLNDKGKKLYNRLEQEDKDRIDEALYARKRTNIERIATDDTPMDSFLNGLAAYASGASLKDCSANINFSHYVTIDGRLLRPGKRLYDRLEGGEGKALVDNALAARKRRAAEQISGDLPDFLKALEPYSKGLDLQVCGKQSGLKKKAKTYFTPEGGLTAKGELLIENLQPDKQLEVLNMVGRRKQFIDPSAQPVPESPSWQLPSSMLDMRGMNQAEMVDPMQTEAMWATAWQMTGQAVPGPSSSAEPPIPYYSSEAVGAGFQHQLWPSTERTAPGESWPYADQYPWQGV
jgi:hypothetical protein